ncbi:hypothetical protein SUDANB19_03871 [Streptomyces sp. enrichment culture]
MLPGAAGWAVPNPAGAGSVRAEPGSAPVGPYRACCVPGLVGAGSDGAEPGLCRSGRTEPGPYWTPALNPARTESGRYWTRPHRGPARTGLAYTGPARTSPARTGAA